jgi:hypothetical protein
VPKEIKLILNGEVVVPADSKEGPEHAATAGGRSTVQQGDQIVFSIGPEFTAASISFDGKSPLDGGNSFEYGKPVGVSRTAAAGLYKYSCKATHNGKEVHSPGGGEMEVVGF